MMVQLIQRVGVSGERLDQASTAIVMYFGLSKPCTMTCVVQERMQHETGWVSAMLLPMISRQNLEVGRANLT
jgi:hypothetical protein